MSDRWFSVLCVPGTFEPAVQAEPVTGMLATVCDGLDERFHCSQVPYPAAYGWPVAVAKSVQVGVDNLLRAIREAPAPVVLLGYSQGAMIVRLVLAELAAGLHPDLVVVAAGLMADPWRPPAVIDGPDDLRAQVSGWGVAGTGSDWPDHVKVWEIAMPRDVITDAPGDSPVRWIADWTEWMSVTDMLAWGRDIHDKIAKRKWQSVRVNWRRPWSAIAQYERAAKDISAYLSGYHTQYAVRMMPGTRTTYSEYLRNLLNAYVH